MIERRESIDHPCPGYRRISLVDSSTGEVFMVWYEEDQEFAAGQPFQWQLLRWVASLFF